MVHNIIQIHNNVTWDWHYSIEYSPHSDQIRDYSVEYCESHETLLWIWIRLCYNDVSMKACKHLAYLVLLDVFIGIHSIHLLEVVATHALILLFLLPFHVLLFPTCVPQVGCFPLAAPHAHWSGCQLQLPYWNATSKTHYIYILFW